MQIEPTMKYHYTPSKMVEIQNTDNTKCRKGCEATGTLIHWWLEYKMVCPLWKTVWWFHTKLNIHTLPYDPASSSLVLPIGIENYVHTKICT